MAKKSPGDIVEQICSTPTTKRNQCWYDRLHPAQQELVMQVAARRREKCLACLPVARELATHLEIEISPYTIAAWLAQHG